MARKTQTAEVQEQVAPAPAATEGQNPIVRDGFNRLELAEQHKTKSAVIRFLHNKGYKVGDIARFLDIRYQHARNVIKQPVKRPVESTQ